MLPDIAVTTSQDSIYVNLYGPMTSTVQMGKREIKLEQTTTYPEEGNIEISSEGKLPSCI